MSTATFRLSSRKDRHLCNSKENGKKVTAFPRAEDLKKESSIHAYEKELTSRCKQSGMTLQEIENWMLDY